MNKQSFRGFTLVEVTLSIGIAAFCWLAILGLLPVGLSSQQAAMEQTAATNILAALTSDLKTATAGDPSRIYQIIIPGAGSPTSTTTRYVGDSGELKNSLQSDSRHRLTIVMAPPVADSAHATSVHARVTWPAAAAVNNATGSMEASFALNLE